jgi:hypothetical protein
LWAARRAGLAAEHKVEVLQCVQEVLAYTHVTMFVEVKAFLSVQATGDIGLSGMSAWRDLL